MASLVRWDPFHDISALQRDMNRLVSELNFGTARGTDRENMVTSPAVDVLTRNDDLVIRAEMPGIAPEDIDISITDDMLSLHGERHAEEEVSEEEYLMHETTWGSFDRTMRLPAGTEIDSITADFHDGILEITVPKVAEKAARTRKVQITSPESKILTSH